jgi:hypothetical protein
MRSAPVCSKAWPAAKNGWGDVPPARDPVEGTALFTSSDAREAHRVMATVHEIRWER